MDFFNTILLNKENLLHNLKIIKSKAKDKKICAMVKANAYGHGLKNIVLILRNLVDYFGVANTEEALEVRQYSYKSKILICGLYNKEKLSNIILSDISITVFSLAQLYEVIKVSKQTKCKAKIHLKINTGMNRLGFKCESNIKKAISIIEKNKEYIILEGVYSHLFNGESKELSQKQYLKFINFLRLFKNLDCINIHLENSQGLFNNVDILNICNMVRVGICLYGLDIENQKLKPVLTLKSKIIAKQNVRKEEYVGYGKNVFEIDGTIAILPIGYADGILRDYKNSFVYVKNIPCKIINVCMDMILIDITNTKANVGDEVIIISSDTNKLNNANLLAKNLNTISYEILTNLKHNRVNKIIEEN